MSYWPQGEYARLLARIYRKGDVVDTADTHTGGRGRTPRPGRRGAPDRAVDTLPVSECFGPTVQGEGLAAGRLVVFVRLMGCNLSCGYGLPEGVDGMRCDTGYTWNGDQYDLRAETTLMTADEIAERVAELAGPHREPAVVISGGEPLLQQQRPAFVRLLGLLGDGPRWPRIAETGQGRPVHIETNGTIPPAPFLLWRCEVIAVSPKMGHAGTHRGHQDPTLHPAWLDVLRAEEAHGVHLKVVVRSAADVAELAGRVARWEVPRRRVWVMPEGVTRDALNYRWPEVADAAIEHGFQATHRLHVLAWGDERGK